MNFNYKYNKNFSLYWLCQLSGWALIIFIPTIIFSLWNFFQHTLQFFLWSTIQASVGILISNYLRNKLKNKIQFSANIDIKESVLLIIKNSLSFGLFYFLITIAIFTILQGISIIPFSKESIAALFAYDVFLIFMWIIIYYAAHFIKKTKNTELEKIKLENLIKDLELQNLKSHVNPHFMFNSLNTIRALIDIEPKRARDAVTELSNILRSSLKADTVSLATFENEFAIAKDYLALEKLRFDERLILTYNIDNHSLQQLMPPMILQTLVENAIKHGISNNINGGKIIIKTETSNSFFDIYIINSGQLLENSVKKSDGAGFGIKGTKERLIHTYKHNASLNIQQIKIEEEDMVEVRLRIPLAKNTLDNKAYLEQLLKKFNAN